MESFSVLDVHRASLATSDPRVMQDTSSIHANEQFHPHCQTMDSHRDWFGPPHPLGRAKTLFQTQKRAVRGPPKTAGLANSMSKTQCDFEGS